MAKMLDKLVSMFGPHRSAEDDILTFVKTEYRNEWRQKYYQLLDEYNISKNKLNSDKENIEQFRNDIQNINIEINEKEKPSY